MYLPAGNQVVALDADTGKEIWSHRTVGGSVQTRAVGYWPGDRTNPARVLYTVGTKMFALNAATGNTDPCLARRAWSISKSPGAARPMYIRISSLWATTMASAATALPSIPKLPVVSPEASPDFQTAS